MSLKIPSHFPTAIQTVMDAILQVTVDQILEIATITSIAMPP
jgi:hypothetical protein